MIHELGLIEFVLAHNCRLLMSLCATYENAILRSKLGTLQRQNESGFCSFVVFFRIFRQPFLKAKKTRVSP